MLEKFFGKKKNLYFAFVDLEKTFDRVPRDIVWLIYILIVQVMYRNPQSRARINSTFSVSFRIKVGVHQRSVLSQLLFICVLEALSREFGTGCPEEMVYADDLLLTNDTMEGLFLKSKT